MDVRLKRGMRLVLQGGYEYTVSAKQREWFDVLEKRAKAYHSLVAALRDVLNIRRPSRDAEYPEVISALDLLRELGELQYGLNHDRRRSSG